MPKETPRIAIIGAGPAGIAAGRELLQQGFSNFTLFDSLDAPGGTWRLHSYPGLACDVWAHSYSFSYAPNPDWSASFVGQAEIQAYLAKCTSDFGLDPHLQLNTRIQAIHWQPESFWRLTAEDGSTFDAEVVINAMGNQHTPLFPDVEGMDSFKGDSWHGTRWNHDVDLKGKRVAIVGSAASAVQIVPEVAGVASHLTVLQRSANWVMPRNRKFYSQRQQNWFRRMPSLIKLTRWIQGMFMGQVEYAVTRGHKRMDQFEQVVHKFIAKAVDDPATREALVPTSRYGCKRGLVSDDFYPALNRDDVELVASGLRKVTPEGLVTEDGREIAVDVIIYCTGYRILDFDRIDVVGAQGESLAHRMADNPQAHKGIAVPGFPNYFFAVGPNGLVLNVSYFKTAERNVETIVNLLSEMRSKELHDVSVKESEFKQYNDWMGERFSQFSWGAPDCHSYYQNAAGHAPFLFPGNFRQYCELHENTTLAEFDSHAA